MAASCPVYIWYRNTDLFPLCDITAHLYLWNSFFFHYNVWYRNSTSEKSLLCLCSSYSVQSSVVLINVCTRLSKVCLWESSSFLWKRSSQSMAAVKPDLTVSSSVYITVSVFSSAPDASSHVCRISVPDLSVSPVSVWAGLGLGLSWSRSELVLVWAGLGLSDLDCNLWAQQKCNQL